MRLPYNLKKDEEKKEKQKDRMDSQLTFWHIQAWDYHIILEMCPVDCPRQGQIVTG